MRLDNSNRPALWLLLSLAMVACDAGAGAVPGGSGAPSYGAEGAPGSGRAGMAPTPEAVSLLGEELHRLPMDGATAAAHEARLDSAEAALAARPDDPDALVWVGRRLAYTGRYRDAIDAFSEGIERHPEDPRFYRHRGHRWITVRELDRAIEDLEHAVRLTGGQPDPVEPDGLPNAAGIPVSTLQTNIWYHLGLARYLKEDFDAAAHAFRTGLEISPNDDMRVAMADWLWMALRRLGRDAEADSAIAFVRPEMEILENDAYHRRLLLYRGLLSPDSLAPALTGLDAAAPAGAGERTGRGNAVASGVGSPEDRRLQLATYGYGLGSWYLIAGDSVRARRTFARVLETGYWPAFGYIAAEAEVARLD